MHLQAMLANELAELAAGRDWRVVAIRKRRQGWCLRNTAHWVAVFALQYRWFQVRVKPLQGQDGSSSRMFARDFQSWC